MLLELDWDSLDSGCLHWTVSKARTFGDMAVVIGVLDEPDRLTDLLDDAAAERQQEGLPETTPLWLYVPRELVLPEPLPPEIVLKRLSPWPPLRRAKAAHRLTGQRIQFFADHPWPAKIDGVILDVDETTQSILLEWKPPFTLDGPTFHHAVASVRSEGKSVRELTRTTTDGVLGVCLTCVPDDRFDVDAPFDLSWWRGGAAAIGSMRLLRD